MFQKCQGSVSFLKETLVTCNCKADCVENQAQDVIFTCVRLAEIKCTASTCLLCPSQSPPGKVEVETSVLSLSLRVMDLLGQQT